MRMKWQRITQPTWWDLDVMNTRLSWRGLGKPRGQHLRCQCSDSSLAGSRRPRIPRSAGNDSQLRWCLYCLRRLCLYNVQPCAHWHRVGRLVVVHHRGLEGSSCLAGRTGAPIIVPIQFRAWPLRLHRWPCECHSGSGCLPHGLNYILRVYDRSLNYTVRWWWRCHANQPFWDRFLPRFTCRPLSGGSTSWIVTVHSFAPTESLHWVWAYFPRVTSESS